MSGLIEQAAKRLEQLRQAGAEIPDGIREPVVDHPVAEIDASNHSVAGATEIQAGDLMPSEHQKEDSPKGTLALLHSKYIDIDLDAIAASGIITPKAPRSRIADEFRVIKRPLIANVIGKGAALVANGNLIMVTSALQGEGKSFTAINLAMSIAAELDNTVMLVDADVARPSVLRMLGLPPGPGLLDVLQDESGDLSKVLLRTNIEKLTILPSGTQHARATEILASDAMANLLHQIANRYPDRIVVFDSPPLLLTTESRVLASHMGQIVMVVQAERTLHSEVKQALATIESCPVKLLVFSQTRGAAEEAYGYGYGYGYGQAA